MGDAESALPPSKKRAAGRELSRDNPGLDDDEGDSEQEVGTFKKASEEVLATRRIVRVRRQQSSTAPSSNPFAGIKLVPPTEASAVTPDAAAEALPSIDKTENVGDDNTASTKDEEGKTGETVVGSGEDKDEGNSVIEATKPEAQSEKAEGDSQNTNKDVEEKSSEASKPEVDKVEAERTVEEIEAINENEEDNSFLGSKGGVDNNKDAGGDDQTQNEEKKDNASGNSGQSTEGTPLSSFQQLSSSQNAFTGVAGTGFSSSTFSFGSISKDGPSFGSSSGTIFGQKSDQSSFSFGLSNNGNSSLFGSASAPVIPKSEGSGILSMKEVPVETGEEKERVVFAADSVLFEFINGAWKERGKGELKVNVATAEQEKARLLMRARGNYRLILNASLYPEMKLTNMDKKGVTFACVNSISDGKDGLSTFAAKFKDSSMVEEFRVAVLEHKGEASKEHKVEAATALKTPENSPKASRS